MTVALERMAPAVRARYDVFMKNWEARNPNAPLSRAAVSEVAASVFPFICQEKLDHGLGRLAQASVDTRVRILDRMTRPNRVISVTVPWVDRNGDLQYNNFWRIQMNDAVGIYKGGFRYHPSVSEDILYFLAYEQTCKNALLPNAKMGGAKGGADFDPKGRTDHELRNFCFALMERIYPFIGPDLDVPAGDIGVDPVTIGYLLGAYEKLTGDHSGLVLTGKPLALGGIPGRAEATGYGAVRFADLMLGAEEPGEGIRGKRVLVSGAGNAAQFALSRTIQFGGIALTMSDSSGYIVKEGGISSAGLDWWIRAWGANRNIRVSEFAERWGGTFFPGRQPWEVKADIAIPAATQFEIDTPDAQMLADNGVKGVSEASNMSSTPGAIDVFDRTGMKYAPGKASNAGGVFVSWLELTLKSPTKDEVIARLDAEMGHVYATALRFGTAADGTVNIRDGANIGGYVRVGEALLAKGRIW